MSMAISPPEKKFMTVEEFLALPDDGTERWLLRGELRPPRISRGRSATGTTARSKRRLHSCSLTRPGACRLEERSRAAVGRGDVRHPVLLSRKNYG